MPTVEALLKENAALMAQKAAIKAKQLTIAEQLAEHAATAFVATLSDAQIKAIQGVTIGGEASHGS